MQLHLWNFNSTSNSPVFPCRLSCQLSDNQHEAETSENINKNCKKHIPRVMTSLLMSSPPISISHRLFRCRYSNSRDVIASFPSFCQSAPESLLAGYFLRTLSAPITTGVVSIFIFHLLALSVNIIRPPSLFLGRTGHDRFSLQFWIPNSSVDVNTLFFPLPQKLTMYFRFSP